MSFSDLLPWLNPSRAAQLEAALRDRILIIDQGHVIADGPRNQILEMLAKGGAPQQQQPGKALNDGAL